jgi:predicted unusual protein kinase regulating ubiquinone biosynthesis (AarF/ABC1/UbiB family)
MAEAPPTSRLARTGRVGGLVAGQGLRWAGTRAANLVRSPERAEAATGERAAALARELVEQLGRMRGAAMKIGQVLSTIDFTAIPESEREQFKQTLATLRDDVPPLPWSRVEKLVRSELGGPVGASFAEFEHDAFAAAWWEKFV